MIIKFANSRPVSDILQMVHVRLKVACVDCGVESGEVGISEPVDNHGQPVSTRGHVCRKYHEASTRDSEINML